MGAGAIEGEEIEWPIDAADMELAIDHASNRSAQAHGDVVIGVDVGDGARI